MLPSLIQTFELIIPAYALEVPAIKMFSVQYLNEFRAKDAGVQSAAEIFRSNSRWLSPFTYESTEPWHCHIGQFIAASDAFRYLVNVNCDVSPTRFLSEQELKNYAKVLILAACQYDIPGKPPLLVRNDLLPSLIESNFSRAHSLEKKLLGEIISDGYLAIMGDGANEH